MVQINPQIGANAIAKALGISKTSAFYILQRDLNMEKSERGRNNCYHQFKKFKFYNMEKRELASNCPV